MAFLRRQPVPDVTGYATPERAVLAHAIAAHAAAVTNVQATDDAGVRASNAVYGAQAAVNAALEGVTATREAIVNHLVAAAAGDDGPAPRTERQARDALADAEAALDAARAARDALKGRLPEAEQARDRAARVRTEAARAVIAAEAADHAATLAAEVEGLQRDALRKGAALRWLVNAGAVPLVQQIGFMHGQAADDATRIAVSWHEMALQNYMPGGLHHAAAESGAAAWGDVLAALERDAAASLPLGGV